MSLKITTKSNVLVLYRCVMCDASSLSEEQQLLSLRFVKILSRIFHVPASSPRIPRVVTPFTVIIDGNDLHGIFVAGVDPVWLLGLSGTPVRVYPDAHKVVFGFSATSAFRSRTDFLFHSDEVRLRLEMTYVNRTTLLLGISFGRMAPWSPARGRTAI